MHSNCHQQHHNICWKLYHITTSRYCTWMHIFSQWGRYPAASSLSQAAQPKGSAQMYNSCFLYIRLGKDVQQVLTSSA